MNDNQNQENNNYVDPRSVQAEVIGELRKDKIGRPELVLQMFILFLGVIIALPFLYSQLNNESSVIYKFIHGNTGEVDPGIVTPTPGTNNGFLDGSKNQALNTSTVMMNDNIVMKNFKLVGNKVNCTMYSYNGVLNLDEQEYYLEIYSSSSNNLVAAVKLTGEYDNSESNVSFTSYGLSFNNNYSYEGKIVLMEEGMYPSVNLNADEDGVASMQCTKDKRTLVYTFKNDYLIGITDEFRYSLKDASTETEYLNQMRKYNEKATYLGDNANVEEISDGFLYSANIDLENFQMPATVTDYEYYKLDSQAKIVRYSLKGKGFDCE